MMYCRVGFAHRDRNGGQSPPYLLCGFNLVARLIHETHPKRGLRKKSSQKIFCQFAHTIQILHAICGLAAMQHARFLCSTGNFLYLQKKLIATHIVTAVA